MLQLEKLTITHQKDLQNLVRDLNLVLNPGEKLAIIGEEGTGKSSLIKAIVAPEMLASYAQLTGTITNHFHQVGYLPQTLEEENLQQLVTEFLYRDLDFGLFDFNALRRRNLRVGGGRRGRKRAIAGLAHMPKNGRGRTVAACGAFHQADHDRGRIQLDGRPAGPKPYQQKYGCVQAE